MSPSSCVSDHGTGRTPGRILRVLAALVLPMAGWALDLSTRDGLGLQLNMTGAVTRVTEFYGTCYRLSTRRSSSASSSILTALRRITLSRPPGGPAKGMTISRHSAVTGPCSA